MPFFVLLQIPCIQFYVRLNSLYRNSFLAYSCFVLELVQSRVPENVMLYVQLRCVNGFKLTLPNSGTTSTETMVTKALVQVSNLRKA